MQKRLLRFPGGSQPELRQRLQLFGRSDDVPQRVAYPRVLKRERACRGAPGGTHTRRHQALGTDGGRNASWTENARCRGSPPSSGRSYGLGSVASCGSGCHSSTGPGRCPPTKASPFCSLPIIPPLFCNGDPGRPLPKSNLCLYTHLFFFTWSPFPPSCE
uniref:Uncharacterized protein n=1 Tax=Ixodes scapularis TaxID=6945 RepID=A0A1S4LYW1_IXOSC